MPQPSQPQNPPPLSVVPEVRSAGAMDTILRGAALAAPARLGWIRVTGSDRLRWLNGMVTQSVQHLSAGSGCYNFFLNAQGKIQGDAFAFREEASLLLQTDFSQVASVMAMLDRYIIMDDVELTDVSTTWVGLLLLGPQVDRMLASIGVTAPRQDLAFLRSAFRGDDLLVLRMPRRVVPRVEVWGRASSVAALSEMLSAGGVRSVDEHAREGLRLLEGTPRYGVDIRDRELPQETGQDQALHFSKGCYLGQEIVERIRSRGSVHRTLSGFRLDGEDPGLDRSLHLDGKLVGELTSSSRIELPVAAGGNVSLALGYVRKEATMGNRPLQYEGRCGYSGVTPLRSCSGVRISFLGRGSRPCLKATSRSSSTIAGNSISMGSLALTGRSAGKKKTRPLQQLPMQPSSRKSPGRPRLSLHRRVPRTLLLVRRKYRKAQGPTAEQTEQSRVAYQATAERLDTAIRAANPGMDHPPPMNFEQLVQSVYMTAIMQLGGGAADEQQPRLDLLGARQSIDMLGVLSERTAGNLSAGEKRLLDGALFDARLAFLEVTQALARSAATKAQAPTRPLHRPIKMRATLTFLGQWNVDGRAYLRLHLPRVQVQRSAEPSDATVPALAIQQSCRSGRHRT